MCFFSKLNIEYTSFKCSIPDTLNWNPLAPKHTSFSWKGTPVRFLKYIFVGLPKLSLTILQPPFAVEVIQSTTLPISTEPIV